MERIALGYDGTSASVAALAWVAARAAREPAVVAVMNVVSKLTPDRTTTRQVLGDAEDLLRERAPGVGVELHRLEGGTASALSTFADDADLLVVGINTGHPIRAALAGAMPLRLSTSARVPVTMVPAGWMEVTAPVTVGVADDDSSVSALAFGAREAQDTGATLRLVHSWLMPTPSFSGTAMLVPSTESVMAEHRKLLDGALSTALQRHAVLPVQTELVRDSRSAALLRFAASSSMLVLGTHRRGIVAGSLLGSVAQEVLWHADCPVTVVPRSD